MPNRKLSYAALAFSILILGVAAAIMALQFTYPGNKGPPGPNGFVGPMQSQPETPLFTLIQSNGIELVKNSYLKMITGSFSMIASLGFTINSTSPIPLFTLAIPNFKPNKNSGNVLGVIFNPKTPTDRHTLKFDVSLSTNCVFQIAESTLVVQPNDVFICNIFYFLQVFAAPNL